MGKDIQKKGLDQGKLVEKLASLQNSFSRSIEPIDLNSWRIASSAALLTQATIPGYVTNDGAPAIEWGTGELITIQAFAKVPDDYDASKDADTNAVRLRLQMLKQGATDNITVTVAVFASPIAGGGRGADLAPAAQLTGAAAFDAVDDPGTLSYDLSGNSLVAGAQLSIEITIGAHATDTIELWNAFVDAVSIAEALTIEDED